MPPVTARDEAWPFFHFWRHHFWPKLAFSAGGKDLSNDAQIEGEAVLLLFCFLVICFAQWHAFSYIAIHFCVCYLHMQMKTLCRAVEISITTSYTTSVRFSFQVHFVIAYMRDRQSVTICRESVVNHDECRHSIVNYCNPYHWLPENYEFKTTFGTNRIRGLESAIASMITRERRQRTLRKRWNICDLSP